MSCGKRDLFQTVNSSCAFPIQSYQCSQGTRNDQPNPASRWFGERARKERPEMGEEQKPCITKASKKQYTKASDEKKVVRKNRTRKMSALSAPPRSSPLLPTASAPATPTNPQARARRPHHHSPPRGHEPAAVLVVVNAASPAGPRGGAVRESTKALEVSGRGIRDPRELVGKGVDP